MTTPTDTPDFATLTGRQQATWATGDFHQIGRQIVVVSEALVEAVDPHAGARVLDVACGSGNTALVAARRFCEVTGVDYVPALLERARRRAAAEGSEIEFRIGDAQALPFLDASFDTIVSVFGVMFAPDQAGTAAELLRVCRPGGRIGLASWMPDGIAADFFGTHARYNPPPPGLPQATRWGTAVALDELFGEGAGEIRSEVRVVRQYYRSVDHAVELYARWFGPTARTMEMLDAPSRDRLRRDLAAVMSKYNVATDGTLIIESTYLQTVMDRR